MNELMRQLYQIVSEPQLAWIFQLTAIFFGLCIGSFLNVCIWRMPRDESIVTTPSHCPFCHSNIAWYDNIPFFSWLILRGRCRHCGWRIPPRYFWIEGLTGILIGLVWLKFSYFQIGLLESVPLNIILVWLALGTFFIDLKHRIIPDGLTYPVLIFGLGWAFLFPELWRYPWESQTEIIRIFGAGRAAFSASLIGIAIWFFRYLGYRIFKKETLGWGDIKFSTAVAACIGIFPVIYILLIASVCGSLFGFYVCYRRYMRGRRKRLMAMMPFGPFLAFALLVWIALGDEFIFRTSQLTFYILEWIGGS